jgi:CheY-like chemotaxis protein
VTRAPVLIVEDDADVREMIATTLELEGAAVVTAANGLEAYHLARLHQPRLIVLDLMMPVMTGEQFRKVQLAHHALRDIPVVVLSAHHDAPHIAARMDVAACLRKPIDIEELQALVKLY